MTDPFVAVAEQAYYDGAYHHNVRVEPTAPPLPPGYDEGDPCVNKQPAPAEEEIDKEALPAPSFPQDRQLNYQEPKPQSGILGSVMGWLWS